MTGATGFVGWATATALQAAGWSLRLLIRKAPLASLPPDAELILGDLTQERALRRLVDDADLVVHVAGAISARGVDNFMAVNRDGTAKLCRAIAASPSPPRLIAISSLAARHPTVSPYAASKRAGEDEIRRILPEENWTILRPPVVYGPGDRASLPLFRMACRPIIPVPSAPASQICLVHVTDLAAAIVALAKDDYPGRVFEISDDHPEGYSWRQLVSAIANSAGRRPKLVPMPATLLHLAAIASERWAHLFGVRSVFSRGKVREMLHPDWSSQPDRQPPAYLWRPTIPLAKGFADTLAWYRRAGWL